VPGDPQEEDDPMRRLATLCWTLLGAGLALPVSARAGQPADCPSCVGGIPTAASYSAGPDTTRHIHPHTRYCPKCQLERAQREAGNNALIISGPEGLPSGGAGAACVACAGGVIVGEAPGIAMLGPGTTSIVSPEPAPIGVVQAGFRPGAGPGSPSAAMATAGRPPYGPALPGAHPGHVPPPQTPMGPPHRRPSVLGHLLGLDGLGHIGDARRARRAAAHAAIPVGNVGNKPLNELPASLVYGR
jgi:hypothetical protein